MHDDIVAKLDTYDLCNYSGTLHVKRNIYVVFCEHIPDVDVALLCVVCVLAQ
jgi:hypothetical protein